MLLQGQLGIRKSHNGFEEALIGSLEFSCSYSSLFFPAIGCKMKQIIECSVCEPLQLTYFNLCAIAYIPTCIFPFLSAVIQKVQMSSRTSSDFSFMRCGRT